MITNLETTVIRDIEYHDFDNALMRNKVWTHIQYGGVDARLVRRIFGTACPRPSCKRSWRRNAPAQG